VNDTIVQMDRAQRRATKTRTKLLTAALSVFTDIGVDAASIGMITERADVGKGTFYRHFSDKHELLAALVEEALDELTERIAAGQVQPRNLEEALEQLFIAHVEFFTSRLEQYILLFQGRMLIKLGRDQSADLEAPYLKYLQFLEDRLRRFLPESIPSTKIRKLSCAIAGFVFGFFSFAMIGLTIEEIQNGLRPLRQAFVQSMADFLGRQTVNSDTV